LKLPKLKKIDEGKGSSQEKEVGKLKLPKLKKMSK